MGQLTFLNVYVRGLTKSSRITTPPVADFTASVVSGSFPLTVSFTDTSTNSPTSWAWDFDNNGTVDSTSQNPTYTYTTAGTYTVKLVATNKDGSGEEIKTGLITVTVPAPVANFTANSVLGTAPFTVNFTDTSTNTPTSWEWDFNNDGSTDSTSQNPSYTYTEPGTYTVKLTSTNSGGSDVETKTGYVQVIPQATYSLSSNVSPVNEGSQLIITLTTTNVAVGTQIPYTITGVTSADIANGSLTGNLTISGTTASGSGSRTMTLSSDNSYEGTETLTFALDNGSASISVPINDTSDGSTYTLVPSAAIVNESASFTMTLNTVNVLPGTQVSYTISGTGITSSDFNPATLTGTMTIAGTLASGTASTTFTIVDDNVTEGVQTFTFALNNGRASTTVQIRDNSLTGTVTTVNQIDSSGSALGMDSGEVVLIDGSPYIYYSRSSLTGLRRKSMFSGTDQLVRLSVNGAALNNYSSSNYRIASHPTLPIVYLEASSIHKVDVNSSTDHNAITVARATLGYGSDVAFGNIDSMCVSNNGLSFYACYATKLLKMSLDSSGNFVANSGLVNTLSGSNYYRAVTPLSNGNFAVLKVENGSPGTLVLQIWDNNLQLLNSYSPTPGLTWSGGVSIAMASNNSTDFYFTSNSSGYLYYYALGGSAATAIAGNGTTGSRADGTGSVARISNPHNLYFYENQLYMIDRDYLRRIT